MVEQRIPNPLVVGSSPTRPAIIFEPSRELSLGTIERYGKSKTKMG